MSDVPYVKGMGGIQRPSTLFLKKALLFLCGINDVLY